MKHANLALFTFPYEGEKLNVDAFHASPITLFSILHMDILQKHKDCKLCKTEKLKKFTPDGYEKRLLDAYTLGGLFFGSLQ